jgi:predicted ester cyclase
MPTEENKALIRRWIEAHNERNHLAIDEELIAPDFVFNGYPLGLGGEKQYAVTTYAAFPDLTMNIAELLAEGDRLAAPMSYDGTHQGDWANPVLGRTIPATYKQSVFTGIAIFQIAGGKILEQWVVRDSLGNLQRLGVVAGAQTAVAPSPRGAPVPIAIVPIMEPTAAVSAEGGAALVRRRLESAATGPDG